jgi:hypothetical protein
MGLGDIARIDSALFTMQEKGLSGDGATDGSFGSALKAAAGTQRWSGAARMTSTDARADPGRFSIDGANASDSASGGPEGTSAADQLAEYLSMPLSKQMFYMVLASLGISPEEYEAMSPEEQAKVAEKVAQRLKENAQAQVKAVQSEAAKAAMPEDSLAASL